MQDDYPFGLSQSNRSYIVGLVFVLLLLFGPVQPYGMVVRTAYLIGIPLLLWLLLYFGGKHLDIGPSTNELIRRAITAGVGGALLTAAFLSLSADFHFACAQVQPDGSGDCIGDRVLRGGPDYAIGFMELMFGLIAFWVAIAPSRD